MKPAPREIRQWFWRAPLCVIAFLIASVSSSNLFAAGGDLDTTFAPGMGANGDVRAIAIQPDGKIMIAGQFRSVDNTPRSKVARL